MARGGCSSVLTLEALVIVTGFSYTKFAAGMHKYCSGKFPFGPECLI